MNTTEMQYQLLAQVVQTGNNQLITRYINQLPPHHSSTVHLFDSCNLPYIIKKHCKHNRAANRLLKTHHVIKGIQMEEEKAMMLETFRNGFKEMFDGEEEELPGNVVELLMHFVRSEDKDYTSLAFGLLADSRVNFTDLVEMIEDVIEKVADRLAEKIRVMGRNREVVDEDMEMDFDGEEDEIEEEDDADASFLSTDSGINEFEVEDLAQEILIHILMTSLLDKNEQLICNSIDFIFKTSESEFSLDLYQKYEIARLLLAYGTTDYEEAEDLDEILMDDILEAVEIKMKPRKLEAFRMFVKSLEASGEDSLSDDTLEILMHFARTDYEVDTVVKLLLAKDVTTIQYRNFMIEMFLMEYPEPTLEMEILIQKIREMEEADDRVFLSFVI
ncbi:hypothetical protein CRE_24966 [Caenorhabditis remanei]|uniref:Uncharacterized protein n=1 Tax=Caenorhabditis remanei TaxID=31234 RepID=E3MHN5_CAERE|nr:hypothetical protein CRE_24966 [Caenorhabditis remanei]